MWDMTLVSSSHLLFFSRSLQPQLLDLLSAASEEGFANQESIDGDTCSAACGSSSLSFIPPVQNLLRGLHPVCHLLSLEVPDCGLLVF